MHTYIQNTLAMLESSKSETSRLRDEASSQNGSVAEILKQQDETVSKVCDKYTYMCISIHTYIHIKILKQQDETVSKVCDSMYICVYTCI